MEGPRKGRATWRDRETCLPFRWFCRVLGVKTRVDKWIPPGGRAQPDLGKLSVQCQEALTFTPNVFTVFTVFSLQAGRYLIAEKQQ